MTDSYTDLLAKDWRVDVSNDGTTWVQLLGINDMNPPGISANNVDASDYDSGGWATGVITQQSWGLKIKANRKASAGVEDPAFVILRARIGQFGDASQVYARWYRTDGLDEGWTGRATVAMSASKTGVTDLNEWEVDLTGVGAATKISPPSGTALPVVTDVEPSGAATGDQVTIYGSGFDSSAAVKFDTVAATEVDVVSSATLVVVVPSGTAGSAPVTVTTTAGASNAFPYTRAA